LEEVPTQGSSEALWNCMGSFQEKGVKLKVL